MRDDLGVTRMRLARAVNLSAEGETDAAHELVSDELTSILDRGAPMAVGRNLGQAEALLGRDNKRARRHLREAMQLIDASTELGLDQ